MDGIRTERLLLRQPRSDDAAPLFAFLGDPYAMQFTQCEPNIAACRDRIDRHESRRVIDGFSPWTVVRQTDARIIGWGGLYIDPLDPDWGPEVGYHFEPDSWGKGYASELVVAALVVADVTAALEKISAFAHVENRASRRVLEKADFAFVREVPEMNRLLFERRSRSSRA